MSGSGIFANELSELKRMEDGAPFAFRARWFEERRRCLHAFQFAQFVGLAPLIRK
jgi:hypothetical protein